MLHTTVCSGCCSAGASGVLLIIADVLLVVLEVVAGGQHRAVVGAAQHLHGPGGTRLLLVQHGADLGRGADRHLDDDQSRSACGSGSAG
ncbi:hypothetical protein ACFUTR_28915 [Streptomyces sp. NPDC057367]|uniref:hypothetical protein n=1 Tax=Streptomyces sp. NPDC057367 TaxID=3346108 RepID=UPI003629FEC9